jgi:transcriptional regulator with XRE-family HTH domain
LHKRNTFRTFLARLQAQNCVANATGFAYSYVVAPADVKKRISLAIKAKRRKEKLGVRAAAKACEIDASTLSRLERGIYTTLPDAGTLAKLSNWLGVSVDSLLEADPLPTKGEAQSNTVPEIVEVHLRADKNLSPKTAEALADMFKALYEQATGKHLEWRDFVRRESFQRWIEGQARAIRKLGTVPTFGRLDPFELAKKMDVRVILPQQIANFPKEKAEQLLLRDPDAWSAGTLRLEGKMHLVVMNPTHKETRQRASLMEELSHILLDHKPSQLVRGGDGLAFRTWNRTQETHAYWVGAAALLPEWVLKGAKTLGWSLERTAQEHGVSVDLVKFREKVSGIRLERSVERVKAQPLRPQYTQQALGL